ncbi:LuxR family transcriptional regulator [Streptomyces sp. NBRC 109706]|uniref:helix-turn-helix transcriptional regulator n=1 Tax=Streptomyces sp. NBRC 109706 TaxID=1550035 RepID=UPI00082DE567|nr:LuxR family transcriptional regulator [Streptomyces sp. NBRC 109706]
MSVHATDLIGRDEEVAYLGGLLRDAGRGSGGAVFLVGEGGVGKSRLAEEIAGSAFDRGMRVLRGRSSTIGPVAPLRSLSEALLPLFRGEAAESLLADPHLGPYRAVLGRLVPDLAGEESESGSLVVLGEALLRLLTALGRGQGNLLVMEDLHDADIETLAVVEYLIDNLQGLPVMLVATIRAEDCPAMDLAGATERRRFATLLRLSPLDRPQVASMMGSCLGVGPEGVPDAALDHVWNDSLGNPYLVEELLEGMIGNGSLVRAAEGWRTVGTPRHDVSSAVLWRTVRRVDRLGPEGLRLMSAAAVLGRRFSLSVLQRMTGVSDRALLSHLHAGVAARLVEPDEPAPDWYAFRHPLTVESMFAQMTPGSRAVLSARAADAIEALHPELPDAWCPLAGELRAAAGEGVRAGRLFTEAGRRALAAGAVGSAITLLERAERLLAGGSDPEARAAALRELIPALAEDGDFERAFALVERAKELTHPALDDAQVAALHTKLAKAAYVAGRWADGNAQVRLARSLLGADAHERDTAQIDVVAAYLAVETPSPARTEQAERLARRAIEVAERHDLPQVACEAWQLWGMVRRAQNLDEATACTRQALRLAERHNLPLQRIYAISRIGGDRWLAEGSTEGIEQARAEALRAGAVPVVYISDGILYLDAVLTGRQAEQADRINESLATASRLRLGSVVRYVLMARATAAAHRGDRAAMEQELAEFERWDGLGSPEEPLAVGLARVFCSLLEEDRPRALRELAHLSELERARPTVFHLGGRHGLELFLRVLAGEFGRERYDEIVDTAAGRMLWNRHFVQLAHAVLLHREGRPKEALAEAWAAQELAAGHPLARHLGLRLLAEDSLRHGWGEPVPWLRRAEHYFQQTSLPAVAAACRTLLRESGASVPQHRSGAERIPLPLRTRGVTVREYEVFQILATRPSNKDIARRLHISPRTVEKHVASLITKTSQDNREAVCSLAAEFDAEAADGEEGAGR